ncbi:MAG: hypothetical protein LBL82_04840 [Oscillospiraceae bacterium]|nr:hypothetical protein [Oscillospiraceae bacterium]
MVTVAATAAVTTVDIATTAAMAAVTTAVDVATTGAITTPAIIGGERKILLWKYPTHKGRRCLLRHSPTYSGTREKL